MMVVATNERGDVYEQFERLFVAKNKTLTET